MIKLGVAGSSGLGILNGLKRCKELGIDSLEVEFTYGVNMSNKLAKEAGGLAKKLGISLSVHCPYYINLASHDKKKINASVKRIIESCERGFYLGAKFIVFHAAFYGRYSKEECYSIVKDKMLEMQNVLKNKGWDLVLCPETTGKKVQFGDLDELIRLSKETGCGICVDFSHLLARDGKIDYPDVMKKIKRIRKKTGHFSGIEFTDKGERRHVMTKEKDIKVLLKYLKKHKISIRIINESPDPFKDCLKSKRILEKI